MQSKYMKAVTKYYIDEDIFLIKTFDKYEYETSLELEEGVILDFDINNNPIALEILDASKIFKLKDKNLFNSIKKLEMNVEATEELIRVKVEIEFNQKNKISSLKSYVLNTIKAPVMETEIVTS